MRRKFLSGCYIGDVRDCKAASGPEWIVVHACKEPCFTGKCGHPKPEAPNYLAHQDGRHLFLNLIDGPERFFSVEIFKRFLDFVSSQWQQGGNLLLHCNRGESRAPSLAILFLAKVVWKISNASFDDAIDGFEELIAPDKYCPSPGIEEFLRQNWAALDQQPKLPSMNVDDRAAAVAAAEAEFQQLNATMRPQDWQLAAEQQPLFHFAAFTQIEGKDNKWIEPVPNALQFAIDEAYDYCMANRIPCRLLILKPRQVGCSTKVAHTCYHHMRTHKADGMIISDTNNRAVKVWELFQAIETHDSYPWKTKIVKSNTIKIEMAYPDGDMATVEHGTAMDEKAGISGTRQWMWWTECARYMKAGGRDKKVMAASMISLANTPGSLGIAESTPEGACYDPETEILTDQGWKFFSDLDGTEQILTRDQKTGVAYYQSEWRPVVHYHKGDMIRLDARSVDLLVTPNHQMWVSRQKGPMRMQSAASMLTAKTDFNFERTFKWETSGHGDFILPSYTHVQVKGLRTIPEKRIPISIWLRYLGYWLSDGHVTFLDGNKCCVLTQVKFPERFREGALNLATAMGKKLRDVSHGNGRRFIIESAQLAAYLVNFSKPKRIPRSLLMAMDSEQCRELLDAIYEGDGDQERMSRSEFDQGKIYCGIDKELVDGIQELALKAGLSTSAYGPPRNRVVSFSEGKRSHLKCSNPPRVQQYEGYVYCVTLPKDHLLMVRRNGTALWCGNSGWFYETWQKAVTLRDRKSGKRDSDGHILVGNGWIKIFAPWFAFTEHVLPRKPEYEEYFKEDLDAEERRGVDLLGWRPEQIAWRRMMIARECGGDIKMFTQDFPTDSESCFLASGRPRFDQRALARLEAAAIHGHSLAEVGTMERSAAGEVAFIPSTDGDAWLWVSERPTPGLEYISFLDPCTAAQAEGSEFPDSHAVGILRKGYQPTRGPWRPTKLVCCIDVPNGCRWDDEVVAERWKRVLEWYGDCMIVPDVGNGLGMLNELKRVGCTIYEREKMDQLRPGKKLKVAGYDISEATRPIVVNALANAIREEQLDCTYLPAVLEFKSFVINNRGKAEAKFAHHDDWCLGIALGLTCLELATVLLPPGYGGGWDAQPHAPAALPGGPAVGALS